MDDDGAYRVPAAWRLLYADSMDRARSRVPAVPGCAVARREAPPVTGSRARATSMKTSRPTGALYQLAKITGDDNYADFATRVLGLRHGDCRQQGDVLVGRPPLLRRLHR